MTFRLSLATRGMPPAQIIETQKLAREWHEESSNE